MQSEEEKLVKRATKGHVNAYGQLIEIYKEYLYRTAYIYTRNEADSLDVVSECVLRGFRSIKKLKEPSYFKTWLTKILINAARDFQAKKHEVELIDLAELSGQKQQTPEITPEEKMDLYNAIDHLSERYKTVIILKYFSDLKTSEISDIMGVPEGTVSAYLNRARAQLRNYLKEDYKLA